MDKIYDGTSITNEYFMYRPKYSDDVRDAIMDYLLPEWRCKNKPELMVEVGCASGQATDLFAPLFEKVYATDASQLQVQLAKKRNVFSNVIYECSKAENLQAVKDGTVDLLLTAESAHWFNLPRFFTEVSRVLKPNGCLAIMGYCYPKVFACGGDKKYVTMDLTNFLEQYLHLEKEHDHVWLELKNQFPNIYNAIPCKAKKRLNIKVVYNDWTFSTIKGFIRSTEAYQFEMERLQNSQIGTTDNETLSHLDPTEVFQNEIMALLKERNSESDEIEFRVEFDVFLLLAKKF